MDLLYFLEARLRFTTQLYDSIVAPFEAAKRRIEANEPPYVDERDPEYADEPAFLKEWQQADDSIMVIGQWCLCMVQASLQAYLRKCIGPLGSVWWNSASLSDEVAKKKGGSWFGRYRLLFLENLGIDWNSGSVSVRELEQLNLTRDDLIHNMDMFSANVERIDKHAERFPTGLFTDELWSGLGIERIKIDRAKLQLAIRLVSQFCAWLDGIRCDYPKFVGGRTARE
jgi:hypothetical protein